MENIGIKRAVRRIALDESEGSPVFTLDLSDSGVQRAAIAARDRIDAAQGLMGKSELTDGDRETVAELYTAIVDSLLGAGAMDTIAAYACDGTGKPVSDMLVALTPLILYLAGEIGDMTAKADAKAYARYTGGDDGSVL